MRLIGTSARLSECKRPSDFACIFVSSHRRGACRRQTGTALFATVAAGPAGELNAEVGFRR